MSTFSLMQFIFAPAWSCGCPTASAGVPCSSLSTGGRGDLLCLSSPTPGLAQANSALLGFVHFAGGCLCLRRQHHGCAFSHRGTSRRRRIVRGAKWGSSGWPSALDLSSVRYFAFSPIIISATPAPAVWLPVSARLNFILAFFILPESRKPGSEQAPGQRPHFEQWMHDSGPAQSRPAHRHILSRDILFHLF